jgi:transmembrane protein TMEM260 (protein O-mannosyltransferase)
VTDRSRPLGLAAAAAVFLVSLAVYVRTLAPTVTLIDSGELILAAHGAGVAHPPGFPLYLVVAHLATLIPIGNIAARVNFVSALFGALAAALTAAVISEALADAPLRAPLAPRPQRRKTDASAPPRIEPDQPRDWTGWIPGAVAGLLLAFSRTLWAYSTVAEVYALNTFMIATVFLLMLRWRSKKLGAKSTDGDVDTPLHFAAFVFGLALGVHHVTVGLMLPALAWLVWRTAGRTFFTGMRLVRAAMFAFAGLCIYAYLPLAASKSPLMNWGDPRTLQRLWWHITGKQYQVFLSFSVQTLGGQFGEFLSIAAREFGWPWLPLAPALAIIGMTRLYRRNRTLFWFLLLIVVSDLSYTLGYDIAEDKDAYFLPVFAAIAIAAAFGVRWLIEMVRTARPRLTPVAAAAAFAIAPVVAFAANLPYENRSRYFIASDYANNIMAGIERGGMLLTTDWQVYAPTLYTHDIEQRRSDVVIFDVNLLRRSWYYAYLNRAYPGTIAGARNEVDDFLEDLQRWDYEPELYAQNAALNERINSRFEAMVSAFIRNQQHSAPVYVTIDVVSSDSGLRTPLAPYQLVPRGLVFQLSNAQTPPVTLPPIETRGLNDGTIKFDRDDVVIQKVKPVYTLMLYNNGRRLEAAGRTAEAARAYRLALSIDPTSALARQALEGAPAK